MCRSLSGGTLIDASSLAPPSLFSNQIPGLENMVGSYGNGPFSCFHGNEHSDHLVASQLTAVSESDSVYKLRVRPRPPLERKLLSRLSVNIWGTHSHFLLRFAQQDPFTSPIHTTEHPGLPASHTLVSSPGSLSPQSASGGSTLLFQMTSS